MKIAPIRQTHEVSKHKAEYSVIQPPYMLYIHTYMYIRTQNKSISMPTNSPQSVRATSSHSANTQPRHEQALSGLIMTHHSFHSLQEGTKKSRK